MQFQIHTSSETNTDQIRLKTPSDFDWNMHYRALPNKLPTYPLGITSMWTPSKIVVRAICYNFLFVLVLCPKRTLILHIKDKDNTSSTAKVNLNECSLLSPFNYIVWEDIHSILKCKWQNNVPVVGLKITEFMRIPWYVN